MPFAIISSVSPSFNKIMWALTLLLLAGLHHMNFIYMTSASPDNFQKPLGFELRTKDDCVQASLNCSMHALCYASINTSNINTTRMCICPKGFTGDGESCKDINECAANELLCSPTTHECVNTNGSYRCDCKNGNQSCEVICAETCKNDGVCRWTNGAAECSCTHNFHGEFCQFYNNKIPTFGGLPISIMFMLIAVLLVLIGITVGLCYKLRKRPRKYYGTIYILGLILPTINYVLLHS
ncbi:uncharacterized protein TRIADDRAFT_62270 [Trichoplax adhaerens]|uniref:EGF-like domain-containing protein n=1 Tax=Trichoplax adhaerens TaxID=10228 RepID=B3SDB2_TRIAD|nr:hypothetical protein TRIADDRAFT_62270 [Trichoplax adhaerens]EDV19288.1 hypothetical protein TRIADDRAFT_62270 [Trichoplax adhaerens]|eukprot:XP_002118212.1 hypothetical protein TRIADDRAFT_62270 [Trichoplax adhaerens]